MFIISTLRYMMHIVYYVSSLLFELCVVGNKEYEQEEKNKSMSATESQQFAPAVIFPEKQLKSWWHLTRFVTNLFPSTWTYLPVLRIPALSAPYKPKLKQTPYLPTVNRDNLLISQVLMKWY